MKLCVQVVSEMRFEATGDGKVWTQTTSAYDFWSRYLKVFDKVEIIARVLRVPHISPRALRADGLGVHFVAVPYYIGLSAFLRSLPRIQHDLRRQAGNAAARIYRIPSLLAELFDKCSRQSKGPVGLEVVGDPAEVFAKGNIRHPLRPFLRFIFTKHVKALCRKADAVAYVNETILRRRYPPGDNAFISNYSSVELPEDVFQPPKENFKKRSRKRIAFIGSLAQKYKGADLLIDAVADCIDDGLDLELIIIGGGACKHQLDEQARQKGLSNRVVFLGQLPAGEAVREQIDAADLFVLPARTEGLPRVIIEAMARAKPCISTTVGGIPELLDHEDLVAPNDSKALSRKITDVLGDDNRMKEMSLRNYRTARQYHKTILDSRRNEFYGYLRNRTEQWLSHPKTVKRPPWKPLTL